ncbi:MAG: hypothetical protein AAB600_01420 [Patescibacteria group bacterium]|mgnify:CR=1 FL=1
MNKENGRHTAMFGGLTPSKGTRDLVVKALKLGLDPTGITLKAGDAARREGRNKVGLFGDAEKYIQDLRQAIDGERWRQESLNKSRPR